MLIFVSCQKPKADLLIYNAHIFTVNAAFDTATVVVICDGKFVAVGGDSLRSQYKATQTLDAKGGFIYPGFMDAHCHFTGYAIDQYKLNLYGTKSFSEILEKTKVYAKTSKRTWIEGRLWDQHDWADPSFPVKDSLDILFPDRPVFLMRIDGHAILCNQKALDLAHITPETKVQEGVIEKKNGKLTGILIDKAVNLVQAVIPPIDQELVEEYLLKTQQEFFQHGLTSFVDCGLENQQVAWVQKAYDDQKLSIRMSAMLLSSPENLSAYLKKPIQVGYEFHIIGFKAFADGSMGSRGAHLLEDYEDQHGHKGYPLLSAEALHTLVKQVYASPYQLNIHAIGDATNREVLQAYARVLSRENDRRWRVEHAQCVQPEDIHLFKDFHIIPSVQPTHATSDMNWIAQRLGEQRTAYSYQYQTLLQQNGWLPLGTDFPVERLHPLRTFYAAVFRQDERGQPSTGFHMENALTREQALRGITIWAAQSVFEEKNKGSIEQGKFADFVLLPINLMKASSKEIYDCPISATYLGGKKVYQKR